MDSPRAELDHCVLAVGHGTESGTGCWQDYFVEQQLECGPRLDHVVVVVGHG